MMEEQPKRPEVILMDVYETLLDMSEVEKRVNSLMNSKRGYMLWFELFMQYCFVDNCTTQFHNFSSIARATLQMTGRLLGEQITENDMDHILEVLKHLPVQNGVQKGLSQLSDSGFRIAALTNSPQATVRERMVPSGLVSFFEMVLSAEVIKKYKPCVEVYQWASKMLDTDARNILLVSAHGWDIAGAVNAGMQTAYIKQNNQLLYPLAPLPTFTCRNLEDLASQLQTVFQSPPRQSV